MFFRKFALLMLTILVLLGWNVQSVSADAKEEVVNGNTIETVQNVDTVTDNKIMGLVAAGEETQKSTSESENLTGSTVPANSETISSPAQSTEIKAPATEKKKTTKKKATVKKKAVYKKSELRLMASIINCEAGGEGMQGKLAVGVVIMNRVKSKSFPNTIKKVVYQKNQFSPVRNGSLRKKLRQYDAGKTHSKQWKDCIKAAKKVLKGQRTVVVKGKVKNMKGYHFFSVRLSGAKFRLGGHRFK